jgi:hypothetical protein
MELQVVSICLTELQNSRIHWTELHIVVIERAPGRRGQNKRRQFQILLVSQKSLWLLDGDSLGTQEGEHPPLETGSSGLG